MEKITQVTIRIETENAAFAGDEQGAEIARILRNAADHFKAGNINGRNLMDYNGNTVGFITVYFETQD